MQESKHRGKNIKIYDKIKLQHIQSGFHLHALEQEWKSGSYNQAVGCHKTRDETDWFVVLQAEPEDGESQSSGVSYHFQYGDKILLSNVSFKKYLHATNDFDSEVSKNTEVSLCENGQGGPNCDEDLWKVSAVGSTYDGYWRVGEQVRLQSVSFGKPLCSHSRRLRESGDNEVYVRKNEAEKTGKQGDKVQANTSDIWMVSYLEPFLYTANLTDKKQPKKTQEADEIQKLRKIRSQLPKKEAPTPNETQELLKLGNERLAQMETAKKKINQSGKKSSWWHKICCCCCPSQEAEYSKL